MLKLVTKSLLIAMLIITSNAFADDELSVFHQQGDIDYPDPQSESSYFATLAPIPSRTLKYIGLNLGLGLTTIKPDVTQGTSAIITETNQKRSATNLAFGLYSGIGSNFGKFYLGGEAGLDLNILNKEITAGNVKMTVKQPLVMGIDLIPGYLINSGSILLYGRLGIGSSWLKVGIKNSSTGFDANTNRFNFGVRAGFGAEFFMNDLFNLRTEYLYTKYNGVSDSGTDSTNSNTYNYKLGSFGVHRLNLGIALRF